jgi:hypothetical protein
MAVPLLASRLVDRYGDAVIIRIVPLVVVRRPADPAKQTRPGLTWFVADQVLMTAGIAVFNVCVRAAVQIGTPSELLGLHLDPAVQSRRAAARRDHRRHPRNSARGPTTIAILMALMLVVPVLLHRSPLAARSSPARRRGCPVGTASPQIRPTPPRRARRATAMDQRGLHEPHP